MSEHKYSYRVFDNGDSYEIYDADNLPLDPHEIVETLNAHAQLEAQLSEANAVLDNYAKDVQVLQNIIAGRHPESGWTRVFQLKAEVEALKTELRKERRNVLGALFDANRITAETYESEMNKIDLLESKGSEKS